MSKPVKGYGSQELIARETPFNVSAAVTPGAKFVDDPRGKSDWGIVKRGREDVRLGALYMGISALRLEPSRTARQEAGFLGREG